MFWHFCILKTEGIGENVPKGSVGSQMNLIVVRYFSLVTGLHSSPGGKLTTIPVVFVAVSSEFINKRAICNLIQNKRKI